MLFIIGNSWYRYVWQLATYYYLTVSQSTNLIINIYTPSRVTHCLKHHLNPDKNILEKGVGIFLLMMYSYIIVTLFNSFICNCQSHIVKVLICIIIYLFIVSQLLKLQKYSYNCKFHWHNTYNLQNFAILYILFVTEKLYAKWIILLILIVFRDYLMY